MAHIEEIEEVEEGLTVTSNEQGVCPICGSYNISYGTMEIEDELVYYPCTCDECGVEYNEWYSLTFISNDNIVKGE